MRTQRWSSGANTFELTHTKYRFGTFENPTSLLVTQIRLVHRSGGLQNYHDEPKPLPWFGGSAGLGMIISTSGNQVVVPSPDDPHFGPGKGGHSLSDGWYVAFITTRPLLSLRHA